MITQTTTKKISQQASDPLPSATEIGARTKRVYHDPLRELPLNYSRDGDIRQFMAGASPWIMEYCRGRLSRDPDLVGDFYLHFYERADICLAKYESRTHMPFTGFLATYLRREFMNFKRSRYGLVREFSSAEFFGDQEVSLMDYPGDPATDLLARGLPALNGLNIRFRLPLKLYYGLDLDSAELRYFVGLRRCPHQVSDFLKDFHARRERMRVELQRLSDRAAHLTLLIHSSDAAFDREASLRRRRWKRRLERIAERKRYLFSLDELADLFGVNKSTMHRRVKKAIQLLQYNDEASAPERAQGEIL